MDFEFDEDQLALQAGAAEVLAKACPPTYLRSVVEGRSSGKELWTALVGLDWPGLALPEDVGGLGATTVELAIVLEQLGYVGDPTPFLSTTTQFAPFVAECGDQTQRKRFLTAVAAEGLTGTVAFAGAEGVWSAGSPPVRATRTAAGWELSGTASWVVDGDRVDEIGVVAAADGGTVGFVVPADGVRTRRTPSFDASLQLAEVCFDGVVVGDERRLSGAPAATGAARALDEAVTGLAVATVGACQRVLDLVVDYVRGREQFGVPIGSFQAVKHKAVDMHVAVERARALGQFAALVIAEDDPRRGVAASMAKAAAGEAQHLVFMHGIQLFGGLGFTWENDLQMYVKRAKAGELLFGSAAEHRLRVARAVLAAQKGTTG